MQEIKQYKDLVYEIIGAAMEVHKVLGGGLLEAVYSEALHLELCDRGIDNATEQEVVCYYKQHKMQKTYRMDMVVGDICIELKSASELSSAHRSQLFNYLRLTKKPIGLLINFGLERLDGERYAYLDDYNKCFLLDRNMKLVGEEE